MTTSTSDPVITGPGVYRTRDGHEVHISNIDGVLERAFPAVGHIIKPDARGRRRRCFSLWALDGGFRAVGEHALDIVGVWE